MKKLFTKLLAVGLAGCGALALSGAAQANDTVTLILSGEAFDGPPAYRVHAGNRSVFGRVTQAIDTASDGRLPFPVPSRHRQVVQMSVDDLEAVDQINISFNNDTDGGERSLVILGAAVNAERLSLGQARATRGAPPTMRRGAVMMVDEGTVTLQPSSFGWPGTESYAAAFNAARVSCLAQPGACPDPLTVSFDNANALAGDADDAAVAGFAAQAAAGNCVVRTVGYASTSGREEFNITLSGERADALASLLDDAGLDSDDIITRAGGETDRFGASNSDNRVAVATPTRCMPTM
ncbi:MAG: OmpA family protein [Devosiaceae bacterium]